MKKSEALIALARVCMDAFMSLAAFSTAYYLRMQWYEIPLDSITTIKLFPPPNTLFPFTMYWDFVIFFTLTLVLVMAVQGRYRFGADEKLLDELQHTFWGVASSMTLLLGYFFFAQEYFFSRLIFGLAWCLTMIYIWSGRAMIRSFAYHLHRWGWGRHHVLLLGTGDLAKSVLERAKRLPDIDIVGVLTEKKGTAKSWQGLKVVGSFKALDSVLKKHSAHEVWLATESTTSRMTAQLVSQAHVNHTKFKFFPDELGLDLAAVKVSNFGDLPIITLLNSPLDGWWAVVKFTFDFTFSLLALIILSPFMFLVGLVIWMTDFKAPIFYRSERVGANGRVFGCYKFRTMVPDAEALKAKLMKQNERKGGVLFKLSDDPRVTKIGHWLRKYSIDELPQLWNVVKGDMSLVGPRPHLQEEVKAYPLHNRQLLTLRPGLTGLAQINGRSSLSFEEEMRHEMFYLKNWSIWLDNVILLKTIWVVLRGENAN